MREGGGGGEKEKEKEERLTHPVSALLFSPLSSRTECEDLTLSISLLTGLITARPPQNRC